MNKMNIVVSTDDNFADYVVVLMNSVYLNNKDVICDFYIKDSFNVDFYGDANLIIKR